MNTKIHLLSDTLKPTVFDCGLIYLSKIQDKAGNLTFVQKSSEIPFNIRRIYYLYDIPGGESRGGHAHKNLEQIIIAAGGSFDVILDDGNYKKVVNLNRPYIGLHVKSGIWRELINFSSGSVSLVLASEIYDEDDYFRDYSKFKTWKNT